MSASASTSDSTKRNEWRNYCEHLRCKETSRQIRQIRKSDLMIVTTANSMIEPPIGDSDGVEKNISPDPHRGDNHPRAGKQPRQNNQPRRDKRDVHGWVVLDKPIGMTSTHAVAVVKRLFQAKRAGHAGTLDPLASGGLPIALGEAKDRSVRDGRPQALSLYGRLGRGTRHRRHRGPRRQNQRYQALRRGHPGPAAAVHRPDRADPAAILRDQGPGRARL